MSLDIAVSSLVPPKFPSRCVLCGAHEPGGQVRFSAGAKYGAFFFVAWFGKGRGSLVAPACGSCAIGALSHSLVRFLVSAAGAGLAAWFLFANMKGGKGLFKLKALAVFFAAVIPAVVWDPLFPARFSVTFNHENHQAICHFADAAYAAEFDRLNHPVEGGAKEEEETPAQQPSIASHPDHDIADSYVDRSNPYRNLEDPRFKK